MVLFITKSSDLALLFFLLIGQPPATSHQQQHADVVSRIEEARGAATPPARSPPLVTAVLLPGACSRPVSLSSLLATTTVAPVLAATCLLFGGWCRHGARGAGGPPEAAGLERWWHVLAGAMMVGHPSVFSGPVKEHHCPLVDIIHGGGAGAMADMIYTPPCCSRCLLYAFRAGDILLIVCSSAASSWQRRRAKQPH